MKPYPHHYTASARAQALGSVILSAPALPPIETAPPPEFGGRGGVWSPETLLCAAVADCFTLGFRGVARAARFDWIELDCQVEGVLERAADTTQFTRFVTSARLTIPQGGDPEKARLLLVRAEHSCLIANSLRGQRTLSIEVVTGESAEGPDEESAGDSAGRARSGELETATGHAS